MPARTAETASDDFVDAQRQAISCIARVTVYGSGTEPSGEQTLSIWSSGQGEPDLLRLKTHRGIGEIVISIALNYMIAPAGIRAFSIEPTRYQYRVLDIAGRELVVYDWHPTGLSPVITPHLHVPAAGSVVLTQRPGSPLTSAKSYIGAMHLPTGPISLAEIVRMFITEFRVDPIRDDREQVLRAA